MNIINLIELIHDHTHPLRSFSINELGLSIVWEEENEYGKLEVRVFGTHIHNSPEDIYQLLKEKLTLLDMHKEKE